MIIIKYSVKELISRFQNSTLDIPNGVYNTVNENGENVIIYINEQELHFTTCQTNNYIRNNVYYKDGTTEEYYDK